MLKRLLSPYPLCLLAGALVGAVFGDRVFPVIEDAFGDPFDNILLGIGGACLAAVLYELVTIGCNLFNPGP